MRFALCAWYNESESRFNAEYDLQQHCIGMEVSKTYEVYWPHLAAGACGTPSQYQTPFYDGVFCRDGVISLDPPTRSRRSACSRRSSPSSTTRRTTTLISFAV